MNWNIKISNGTTCWLTDKKTRQDGYVVMRDKEGKTSYAHRIMYEEVFGSIPEGLVVRHDCDNPSCVNPYHLTLGEHPDNVADRVKRNRSATGTRNGRSKLSEDDVVTIFLDRQTPKTVLAKWFGIDARVIRDIQERRTWKFTTRGLSQFL